MKKTNKSGKIQRIGGRQVVILPEDLELEADEVEIIYIGDYPILVPKEEGWQLRVASLCLTGGIGMLDSMYKKDPSDSIGWDEDWDEEDDLDEKDYWYEEDDWDDEDDLDEEDDWDDEDDLDEEDDWDDEEGPDDEDDRKGIILKFPE